MKFLSRTTTKSFVLYLVTITVAFCSIVYELILAHSVSLVAGSAVTWYGLIVGAYLGSLGVGSFFAFKLMRKGRLLSSFLQVELSLALFGGVSVVSVFFFQVIYTHFIIHGNSEVGRAVFLMGVFLMVFLIGFLSGVELPLLIEAAKKVSKKMTANRVLAADYFGSLFGAVAFPLFFVPNFNMFMVSFLVATANLVVALLVLVFLIKNSKRGVEFFVVQFLILSLLMSFGFKGSDQIEQYFTKKYYYYVGTHKDVRSMLAPMTQAPDVSRTRSRYQVIDLVQTEFETSQEVLMNSYKHKTCAANFANSDVELYLNGDWQLNGGTEIIYHEYFAHVPIQLNGKVPESVLILGAGDGMLDRELLKYSEVKKITHVDLDDKMIELASNNESLVQMNGSALSDERVNVIIGDGFSFVRGTEEKFDAVYFDFPTPVDFNTAKLYSKEFYSFAGEVLNDDGYVAYDIPGTGYFFSYDKKGKQVYKEEDSPLPSYYATIRSAGFETVVPFLSRLEVDNEEALVFARDHLTKKQLERNKVDNRKIKNQYFFEKKREMEAKEYVQKFATEAQEGFIFAKKEKVEVNRNFENKDIGECLLNEKRFLLSLEVSVLPEMQINKNDINSIMRPRMPLAKFSQIRLPYYIQ